MALSNALGEINLGIDRPLSDSTLSSFSLKFRKHWKNEKTSRNSEEFFTILLGLRENERVLPYKEHILRSWWVNLSIKFWRFLEESSWNFDQEHLRGRKGTKSWRNSQIHRWKSTMSIYQICLKLTKSLWTGIKRIRKKKSLYFLRIANKRLEKRINYSMG